MKKLSEVDLQLLRWVKSGELESQLAAGDQLVATLRWSGRGSLATGESADGEWTFKRVGFLRPKITVREAGSSSDFAVLSMRWGPEGILRLTDGSSYVFTHSGFWHPVVTVLDSKGGEILNLAPRLAGCSKGAVMKIENPVKEESRQVISMLVILSWYMILLTSQADDDVATTAAIVGAVVATGAV